MILRCVHVLGDHPVTNGLPVQLASSEGCYNTGNATGRREFPGSCYGIFRYIHLPEAARPEPVLVARNVGQGRIFMTMLGTPDLDENQALQCAGFIVTLQRGAEWAATGTVTQEVPFDFPTAADAVLRPDYTGVESDEAFEKLGSYEIGSSTLYLTWLQSQIRKASGNEEALLNLEKKMVEVLRQSGINN